METTEQPTEPTIDFNKRVDQFVKLRDIIKKKKEEQKAELKPYEDTLQELSEILLSHLNRVGADKVGSAAGTVYKTEKCSASVADMSAFWTYVITQAEWELVDRKANVTAVKEYIEKQIEAAKDDPSIIPGPPPGVNYTSRWEVGVRRK